MIFGKLKRGCAFFAVGFSDTILSRFNCIRLLERFIDFLAEGEDTNIEVFHDFNILDEQ
jgi:hypothetical protein